MEGGTVLEGEGLSAEQAQAEARKHEAKAAALEDAALNRGKPVDLGAVDEHRRAARHWNFRAAMARRAAERQAKAERAAALAELAGEIKAAAAAVNPAVLGAALTEVAAAGQRFLDLVGEHDARVAGLVQRAVELGCGAPGPSGPAAGDGFISVLGGAGIQAGNVVLRPAGDQRGLLEDAVLGRSVHLPAAVSKQPEAHRPRFVYVAANGNLFPTDAEPSRATVEQLANGSLVELTAAEVDAFTRGELQIPPEAELQRRRGVQAQHAAEAERRRRAEGKASEEKALAQMEAMWR